MKNTHETMEPGELLELLASYGLKMDMLSGGRHITDDTTVIKTTSRHQYDLSYPDGDSVLFFDSHFFLKTVELTEQSLKVKLFV